MMWKIRIVWTLLVTTILLLLVVGIDALQIRSPTSSSNHHHHHHHYHLSSLSLFRNFHSSPTKQHGDRSHYQPLLYLEKKMTTHGVRRSNTRRCLSLNAHGSSTSSTTAVSVVKSVLSLRGGGSASASASSSSGGSGVIPVTLSMLGMAMGPMVLLVCWVSWKMGLELERSVISGSIRTFVQLSLLSFLLKPIFAMKRLYMVVGYCTVVMGLAARIACHKTKYMYRGQYISVLLPLIISVTSTAMLAFGIILRPQPVLWNPQYVIPMVGMLLGNSINGISIAMNQFCTSLVEQQREMELYLAFGATYQEAVSRLLVEAVRAGTRPVLNMMAVTGMVSIPGMMTGQIVGGTPVLQAARYQMLILYLIALSSFTSIFLQIYAILDIAFDSNTHILQPQQFQQQQQSNNSPSLLQTIQTKFFSKKKKTNKEEEEGYSNTNVNNNKNNENVILTNNDTTTTTTTTAAADAVVGPQVYTLKSKKVNESSLSLLSSSSCLELKGLSKSVPTTPQEDDDYSNKEEQQQRLLFDNFSLDVKSGTICLIQGPSGCGKTQLLRSIAGLSPLDQGTIVLNGISMSSYYPTHNKNNKNKDNSTTTSTKHKHHQYHPNDWKQQVRYVTQYKVEIPGTPYDFIRKIVTFQSYPKSSSSSIEEEEKKLLEKTLELVLQWGLSQDCIFHKDWSMLSGGEAQRVLLAISLASNPKVLLLDESTSALDIQYKSIVEQTIHTIAQQNGIQVLYVSHDPHITKRFQS